MLPMSSEVRNITWLWVEKCVQIKAGHKHQGGKVRRTVAQGCSSWLTDQTKSARSADGRLKLLVIALVPGLIADQSIAAGALSVLLITLYGGGGRSLGTWGCPRFPLDCLAAQSCPFCCCHVRELLQRVCVCLGDMQLSRLESVSVC